MVLIPEKFVVRGWHFSIPVSPVFQGGVLSRIDGNTGSYLRLSRSKENFGTWTCYLTFVVVTQHHLRLKGAFKN